MNAIELASCPFCGGNKASLRRDRAADMSWVSCPSCGLECPSETGTTDEAAAAYWNRRAALPEAPGVGAILDREEGALLKYREEDCQGDDPVKRHAWTVADARLSEVRVLRALLSKHASAALTNEGAGE